MLRHSNACPAACIGAHPLAPCGTGSRAHRGDTLSRGWGGDSPEPLLLLPKPAGGHTTASLVASPSAGSSCSYELLLSLAQNLLIILRRNPRSSQCFA